MSEDTSGQAAGPMPSLASCPASLGQLCSLIMAGNTSSRSNVTGSPVTNETERLIDPTTYCISASFSGSPSYSGPLAGSTGSASLSASATISISASACVRWSYNIATGFTGYYVNFYESFDESLDADLIAGAGGFQENTFNTVPLPIANGPSHEWSIGFFLASVSLSINTYLGLEYNVSLTPNAGVLIQQGATGWANQNYNFSLSHWTDTNSPLTCTGGLNPSNGCALVLPSQLSLGSNAEFRVGPEAALTGAVNVWPLGAVGSLTGWVFVYGQLSLFSGQGPTSGDLSGGDCGSGYAIDGLPSVPALAGDYWLAVCFDVGLQYGVLGSGLSGAFEGSFYTSAPYVLWAGPLGTTVNIYDSDSNHATAAFTLNNPVTPNPSFTMEVGTSNTILVITPLVVTSTDSVGGTWGPPTCGTISYYIPMPAGGAISYTAPGSPGTCQLTLNTPFASIFSVPILQLNNVTFNIKVDPTYDYAPYLHFVGAGHCWPVYSCVGPVFVNHVNWSVRLQGAQNYTLVVSNSSRLTLPNVPQGTYNYTIYPFPGLTPDNGTSGKLSLSGADQYLSINFSRLSIDFQAVGLEDQMWGVTIDGVTVNSTNSTLVFNATPGNLTYQINSPQGYYVSPSAIGNVTLNATNVTVPVVFTSQAGPGGPGSPTAYPVQFLPTGLPAGDVFTVTLLPGVSRTGPAPTFELVPGEYDYSIMSPAGFRTVPNSGTFVVAPDLPPMLVPFASVTFPVTLGAFGLPRGTSWSATIAGTPLTSNGTTQVFYLANGTYSYSVTPIPDYTGNLSGSIVVNGSGTSAWVYFTPVTYEVYFQESGLPTGTPFSASVGGQSFTTAVNGSMAALFWEEFNGSYAYQVSDPPGWTGGGTGTVSVAGRVVTVNTTFVPASKPYYRLTFKEKGLPGNSTWWSVIIGNMTLSSHSATAVFSLESGTYSWTVPAVPGYAPVVKSGSVTIHKGSRTVDVKFKPVPYAVTFTESGLPSGHAWKVKVPGFGTKSSKTDTIVFSLPNGSYNFTVGTVKGYTSSAEPSPVPVNGTPASVAVTFTRDGVPASQVAPAMAPLSAERLAESRNPGALAVPALGVGFLGLVVALGAARRPRRNA